MLDQLADLGCRRIGILGGEPLLRPDLKELITHVKNQGMSCVLTSNGRLVPERIQDLTQVDTLILSLDGIDLDNDDPRGLGSYDSVLKAVAAAQAAGLSLKINSVMSADTAHHLDDLLAFIETQDLYISLNIARTRRSGVLHGAADSPKRNKESRMLLARIARLSRQNPRIVFSSTSYSYAAMWDDFSILRYERDDLSPDDPLLANGPHCHAGRYFMSILPDGQVAPCVVTIDAIQGANVSREGVLPAWRSLGDHNCAVCSAVCMLEQNYLFSLHPRVLSHFIRRHLPRFS